MTAFNYYGTNKPIVSRNRPSRVAEAAEALKLPATQQPAMTLK